MRFRLIVNVEGRASQIYLFCLFPEAKDIENLVFTPLPHYLFKIRNNNSRQLPRMWAGGELILGKQLKGRADNGGSYGVPMVNCGYKK